MWHRWDFATCATGIGYDMLTIVAGARGGSARRAAEFTGPGTGKPDPIGWLIAGLFFPFFSLLIAHHLLRCPCQPRPLHGERRQRSALW